MSAELSSIAWVQFEIYLYSFLKIVAYENAGTGNTCHKKVAFVLSQCPSQRSI
jgi:hypothetical protein